MCNIPLIVYLGKNLSEYGQQTADRRTFTTLINQHFPLKELKGHKAACNNQTDKLLKYHGSYLRTKIIATDGNRHKVTIHRFYCPSCRATWSVYPTILVPGKHYDSYVIQNNLEDSLSHDLTYRSIIRQQTRLTSSGQAQANAVQNARTPWHWVNWLGQFALPLVLLACGLTPPVYAVEDEKFLKQNGEKSYTIGLVDQRYDVVWWLDYVFATNQQTLEPSLRTLCRYLKHHPAWQSFKGITVDSWSATKNAFLAICPDTKLAECLLHPLLKFEEEVRRYARYTNAPAELIALLKEAFTSVVFADCQADFEEGLAELETSPEFAHPILADRLKSLRRKQAGLTLHFSDPNLALTSNPIDRIFKRLERKFSSMQQFRTDKSGKATLNAWAIVYNFRRFGIGAKRFGQSPVELAGIDLQGLPWLQFILIHLSKVRWLKSANFDFHNLLGL